VAIEEEGALISQLSKSNKATATTPTSSACARTDRVSNPVQRALAEIAPGFGQAETGPIQPLGTGVISGKDPRHEGAPFVNQVHRAPLHRPGHRGRGHIPRGLLNPR
jgi:hypothetical protein